jgi:hypothetical protein
MKKVTSVLAFIMTLSPGLVIADTGTPLALATVFQLLVGNFLLGLLEGAILAKVFKLRLRRCIGLMILANYFSAWVGWLIVRGLSLGWPPNLYHAVWFSWILLFVTYALTLLLEWPFVASCLRGAPHWFAKSLKGSVIIQTISYLLLVALFWPLSYTDLYTHFTFVPPERVALPTDVYVFYVSKTDGNVYCRSAVSGAVKVSDLKTAEAVPVDYSLHIRPSEKGKRESWDLVAVPSANDPWGKGGIIVVPRIMENPPQSVWQQYEKSRITPAQIGSATQSRWEFVWGRPIGGRGAFGGRNKHKGEGLYVGYDTPIFGWDIWRPIHLPGDKILFQLGKDQLCLLDVETRQIALWERGHGAVAVPKEALSIHQPLAAK